MIAKNINTSDSKVSYEDWSERNETLHEVLAQSHTSFTDLNLTKHTNDTILTNDIENKDNDLEFNSSDSNSFEPCLICGSNLVFSLTPFSIHYGRLDCPKCKKWIKWVPKNIKDNGRSETSKYSISQVIKFHKKDKELCFFCLRTREQLGVKETLTIDHIEELDKDGLDELENLQILCSACHRLKNWARLYMNWHVNKFEVKNEITPIAA